MKKTLFILGVVLLQLNCFSQPTIQWQKTLGGSSDDYGFNSRQTSDGGYIVAGATYSNDGDVTGNHGDYDCWIVKMSPTGMIQWQKTLGGSAYDVAFSIRETADGGYIVGGETNSTDGDITINHGESDCWIIKLNTTGTIQWQKTFGGAFVDVAMSMQQTTDGGYILAGYSNSTDGDVTSNHGGFDYWILKLDTVGTIQWEKTFGGANQDFATSIQQTAEGGYIVVGSSNSYDGDVTINLGSYDFWVVKLDATGTIQWKKSLGGTYSDEAQSIRQTADGGYIVAGNTVSADGDVTLYHGNYDYWVVKLNPTGTIEWQKALGGFNDDVPTSVQQTSDGGYIIAGWTYSLDGDVKRNNWDYNYDGYNYLGNDYWIVKLTSTGAMQWQTALGGTGDDDAFSIQQTTDGGYIVAGMSSSTDGNFFENNGNHDFWIVKLEADLLSTSSFYKEHIVIYPNPVKSILNIQFPDDVLIDKIIIIDLTGKIIMEQTNNTAQINTEGLASGMYLIQAISGEKKWQSEFFVE